MRPCATSSSRRPGEFAAFRPWWPSTATTCTWWAAASCRSMRCASASPRSAPRMRTDRRRPDYTWSRLGAAHAASSRADPDPPESSVMTTHSLLRTAFAVLGLCCSLGVLAQSDLAASAANEKGATVTPSGLVYRSLADGKGPSPVPTDIVKVNYRGTL